MLNLINSRELVKKFYELINHFLALLLVIRGPKLLVVDLFIDELLGLRLLNLMFYGCMLLWRTGYLACARCSASGVVLSIEPISVSGDSDRPLHAPTTQRCLNCAGAGKVGFFKTIY